MPARYTTLLRDICEFYANENTNGLNNINDVLDKSWNIIFTNNWEIFDESYRKILCEKILRTYFTREICAETVELWKLWLDATMCEIMPTYNQLYESTLIKYDVFNNVDVTTAFEKSGKEYSKNTGNINTTDSGTQTNTGKSTGNVKGTTISNSKNNGTEWDLHSDTPQGGIDGVENEQYLSDATKRTNNSNADSTVTNSENNSTEINNTLKTSNTQINSNTNKGTKESSEEWTQRIFGKNNGQSNASLLKEFRENILNIDQMIIKDLETLFFQLW
nr:MAG TPA: Lower collar protein [Caudoviricetes sp.]